MKHDLNDALRSEPDIAEIVSSESSIAVSGIWIVAQEVPRREVPQGSKPGLAIVIAFESIPAVVLYPADDIGSQSARPSVVNLSSKGRLLDVTQLDDTLLLSFDPAEVRQQ